MSRTSFPGMNRFLSRYLETSPAIPGEPNHDDQQLGGIDKKQTFRGTPVDANRTRLSTLHRHFQIALASRLLDESAVALVLIDISDTECRESFSNTSLLSRNPPITAAGSPSRDLWNVLNCARSIHTEVRPVGDRGQPTSRQRLPQAKCWRCLWSKNTSNRYRGVVGPIAVVTKRIW